MTNGGWFNHYDDPDEFWDDEPLPIERTPLNPSPSPSPPQNPSSPPQKVVPTPKPVEPQPWTTGPVSKSAGAERLQSGVGSSFVAVQVDAGLLPVHVQLSPQWHRHVDGSEAGAELMRAYQKAIGIYLGETIKSGKYFSGEFRHPSAPPDRRTVLMLLLETASWADYRETQTRIYARNGFEVHGQAQIQNEPVTSMRANWFQVKSIRIWPDWARRADPIQIVDEVLCCANRVRELRPTFKIRGDYSRYSDEDLEYQHLQHRENLIEELGV
ncbi:hypothetical protein [Nocardia sp. NBC_00403]|uniref:hypothetical protein n=1 Tax=Nocardia sp. NBC_00403 TaxID=2975990 RepID=UPI002E1EFA5D